MSRLQTLMISGNPQLAGTLPASWGSGLQNLSMLRLKFDALSGKACTAC